MMNIILVIIIVFIIGALFFFVSRMLGNKKKGTKGITGDTVKVKIIRQIADKIPVTVAEFDATQEKDKSFNLVLSASKENFKEDFSLEKFEIIETLKYKLESADLNHEEKLKAIDEKINQQKKLIKELEDNSGYADKEKTQKINKIDVDVMLRFYKGLRHAIENEGSGSYEAINLNGEREIVFLSKDGILTPIFYNATELTFYPDITTKRKLYKEKDEEIEKRWLEAQQGLFGGWLDKLLKIAVVVLIVANIMWTSNNIKRSQEISLMLDESYVKEMVKMTKGDAQACYYYYAQIMKDNSELLNYLNDALINETISLLEIKEKEKQQEGNVIKQLADSIIDIN